MTISSYTKGKVIFNQGTSAGVIVPYDKPTSDKTLERIATLKRTVMSTWRSSPTASEFEFDNDPVQGVQILQRNNKIQFFHDFDWALKDPRGFTVSVSAQIVNFMLINFNIEFDTNLQIMTVKDYINYGHYNMNYKELVIQKH